MNYESLKEKIFSETNEILNRTYMLEDRSEEPKRPFPFKISQEK